MASISSLVDSSASASTAGVCSLDSFSSCSSNELSAGATPSELVWHLLKQIFVVRSVKQSWRHLSRLLVCRACLDLESLCLAWEPALAVKLAVAQIRPPTSRPAEACLLQFASRQRRQQLSCHLELCLAFLECPWRLYRELIPSLKQHLHVFSLLQLPRDRRSAARGLHSRRRPQTCSCLP